MYHVPSLHRNDGLTTLVAVLPSHRMLQQARNELSLRARGRGGPHSLQQRAALLGGQLLEPRRGLRSLRHGAFENAALSAYQCARGLGAAAFAAADGDVKSKIFRAKARFQLLLKRHWFSSTDTADSTALSERGTHQPQYCDETAAPERRARESLEFLRTVAAARGEPAVAVAGRAAIGTHARRLARQIHHAAAAGGAAASPSCCRRHTSAQRAAHVA